MQLAKLKDMREPGVSCFHIVYLKLVRRIDSEKKFPTLGNSALKTERGFGGSIGRVYIFACLYCAIGATCDG